MKFLNLLFLSCLLFANAYGAGIDFKTQSDLIQHGKDGSTANKKIIFNTGDGASNPKIEVDQTSKHVGINKPVDITGNTAVTGNVSATGNVSGVDITGTGNAAISGTAAVGGNITIGSGVAADKSIIVNRGGTNPYLKWDNTLGAWVFSDGNNIKKFGSGSGGGAGGIELLQNASFEDAVGGSISNWTATGGTLTQVSYTNGKDPNLKYARFVATTSGQKVCSDLTTIPDLLTTGTAARMRYKDGDSAFTVNVYDSAETTTYATYTVGDLTSFAKIPYQSIPVLPGGTQYKFCIVSTAAGTIDFDDATIAGEARTFELSQATIAGESYFAGTASCSGWVRSSSIIGAFTTDADCPGPTITNSSMGSWQTTDSDLPKQTINNLPAGKYRVKFLFEYSMGGSSAPAFSVYDGTSYCSSPVVGSSDNSQSNFMALECIFNYTTSGTRNFELHGGSNGAFSITLNNLRTSPSVGMKFVLEYFPSDSLTALVPEAQDWIIDANIGGANPSLGSTAQTSYIGIEDTALDLVLNTGSASAQIGCSSTNSPSGLTCAAGSESVSIAWTPPAVGWYEVCFEGSHAFAGNASGDANVTFQVIETPVNAQTISTEGRSKINSRMTGVQVHHPLSVCGTFYASSISQKVHRLMYEQSITATVSLNALVADRSASLGQRDIRVTVKPVLLAFNRPYLTGDQVTTPTGSKFKICPYSYGGAGTLAAPTSCTGSPCTKYNDPCNMISGNIVWTSTGDTSGGVTTVGWAPNAQVSCTVQANTGADSFVVGGTAANASGVFLWGTRIVTGAGTPGNGVSTGVCMGERQ